MLLLTSHYDPPPATAPRPVWPAIIGIGCLIIALLAGWSIYKAVSTIESMASGENRELTEAMVMMALADVEVIRGSAEAVDITQLAASPSSYSGKWLSTEGSVVWLQGPDGGRISQHDVSPGETFLYWLDGPLIVHDTSDALPVTGQAASIRAFGRCIEVPINKLGLSTAGYSAVDDMDGNTQETVAYFIAKWVEAP